MHNKVVTMVARALRELGATTVRFNFRGTGASEGAFDHGKGEREDLGVVVEWVRAARPDAALWLAGFSFGSFVSLSAAAQLQPDALISIAPPVSGRGWDFSAIEIPEVPWLVVQGDADEIVDAQAVHAWIEGLARKPQLVRMVDTSHFFHRKLIDLRGAIQHEVRAWLPERMARTYSAQAGLRPSSMRSNSAKPLIEFSGLRRSCDIWWNSVAKHCAPAPASPPLKSAMPIFRELRTRSELTVTIRR